MGVQIGYNNTFSDNSLANFLLTVFSKTAAFMLYTDGSYLIADSLHELYQYASKVGLNPEWIHFMGRTIHPHFDICGHVKRRVLRDENVKQVSRREIVRLLQLNYRLPETEKELKEWEAHHEKEFKAIELPSERDYKRMFREIFRRSGLG